MRDTEPLRLGAVLGTAFSPYVLRGTNADTNADTNAGTNAGTFGTGCNVSGLQPF